MQGTDQDMGFSSRPQVHLLCLISEYESAPSGRIRSYVNLHGMQSCAMKGCIARGAECKECSDLHPTHALPVYKLLQHNTGTDFWQVLLDSTVRCPTQVSCRDWP